VMTFILAMVLNPDVLARAQEELDRKVGKDTLPTFADMDNLPYIQAIVQECLRWEVLLPLGAAHIASQDDTYKGYLIPAGTVIYPNQWSFSNDPRYFESPDEFMPERWLPCQGRDLPAVTNKVAFGYGRRLCAGLDLAQDETFIAIAHLLATFNISKELDENGTEITPDRASAFMPAMIRRALSFPCKITPRSKAIFDTVKASVESL